MEIWSTEWKLARLNYLRDKWINCELCNLCKTRQKVVYGEGNPNADIVFVGEGPGGEEDKTGRPFSGPSGAILSVLFERVGIERDDVYLTNIVGCRTSKDNRDPTAVEKDSCLLRVFEIIYTIDPFLIVAVGKYALNALEGGRSLSIEREHGSLFSSPDPQILVPGERNGVVVPGKVFPRKGLNKKEYNLTYDMVPIYHPAYILRTDSIDVKRMEFPEGGLAYQTLEDLYYILERVKQLKQEYEVVPRMIERMKP